MDRIVMDIGGCSEPAKMIGHMSGNLVGAGVGTLLERCTSQIPVAHVCPSYLWHASLGTARCVPCTSHLGPML